MLSRILVRDFMKPVTVSFSPNTPVEAVVKTLVQKHVTGAPVMDEQHHLLGFITEQDCLRQMLNDSYYCQDHDVASSIMRSDVLAVGPDEDILKLAQMMMNQLPKRYPVVEDGRVIGMITRTDILKALSINRIEGCRA